MPSRCGDFLLSAAEFIPALKQGIVMITTAALIRLVQPGNWMYDTKRCSSKQKF